MTITNNEYMKTSERIDFHCHILPEADHGSDGIATSLLQLKLQKDAGIKKIVATPHFYPHMCSVEAFLNRRSDSALMLKEQLSFDAPEIFLGAEVLLCPGMDELKELPSLCIQGTNCLLLEMPFTHFDTVLLETVEKIVRKGEFQIVMAHIDRYDTEDVESLMELPVWGQINAESLLSKSTRRNMQKYFTENRIAAFASDLHMANKQTISKYLKGLSKFGSDAEEAVNNRAKLFLSDAVPLQKGFCDKISIEK